MYLKIGSKTTLTQLSARVSHDNVGELLAVNGLSWQPNIGEELDAKCSEAVQHAHSQSTTSILVPWPQKFGILNRLTSDSDVFEYACSMDEDGWAVMQSINTFPGMLRVPDNMNIPTSDDTMGNQVPVPQTIYRDVTSRLTNPPHEIDNSIFNDYSSTGASRAVLENVSSGSIFEAFHIPWGEVTLHSSAYDTSVDFPVYPETMEDGVQAEYSTMPDMLYQYEPWYVYKSSGPRANKYSFHFHRDMWTGDHRDGMANKLIRFCEAQCYPRYWGSAVIPPTVSLFVGGKRLISGIMTSVDVSWSGPLGLDKFYLECKLDIAITEVSLEPLDNITMMSKRLIG